MAPKKRMSNKRQRSFKDNFFFREYGNLNTINFKFSINRLRLSNLSLSKLRDVKVAGHGAITTVAIDPLGKKHDNFLNLFWSSSHANS